MTKKFQNELMEEERQIGAIQKVRGDGGEDGGPSRK